MKGNRERNKIFFIAKKKKKRKPMKIRRNIEMNIYFPIPAIIAVANYFFFSVRDFRCCSATSAAC